MGLDLTIKISKKKLFLHIISLVVIFLYLPPLIISVDPARDFTDKVIRICAGIISVTQIILYLSNLRNIKKTYPIIIGLLFGIIEYSNMKNGYSFERTASFVIDSLNIIGLTCLLVNINKYNRLNDFLDCFVVYSSAISISNLFTQIFNYGTGLYHNFKISWQPYYLCGNANAFVFFYTVTLAILYAQAEKSGRYNLRLYGYFINICMIYSAILGHTTTGTVCALLFLILNILSDTKIIEIIIKHSFLIFIVFALIVVWFIALRGWNEEFVKTCVEKLVHERRNLLTRGEIWDFSMKLIKKKPQLGYGSMNSQLSFSKTAGIRRSAHNTYLQITLYGGFMALAVYLVLISISICKIAYCNAKGKKQYILAFFIFLLSYVFEQNPFYIGFYMLLALMYLEAEGFKYGLGEN